MKKIKVHCSWELEIDMEHEKQIELYVDTIPTDMVPKNTVRFIFLLEAIDWLNLNSQAIDGYNKGYYNFLFTHNETLLEEVSGAHLFEFGTTWIKDYDYPEKEFAVSALVGGKNVTAGHRLRQKLWFKQDRIEGIKKNFFISGNLGGVENFNNNPVLGDKKNPLFDSQFHICIEQGKRDNYFSEKLMDCLTTKTVPIYWGCPNIGGWFDTRGFIMVDNLKDIIEACETLTPETYQNMLPYVEDNLEKSKKYATISDRLENKIKELM
jgi:hypothetical protein